jgi:hypothetical protein
MYIQNPTDPVLDVVVGQVATFDCFWVTATPVDEDVVFESCEVNWLDDSSVRRDQTYSLGNALVHANQSLTAPSSGCWHNWQCPPSQGFIKFYVHRPEPDGRTCTLTTYFNVGRGGC